jgi:hypothetical protein
MRKTKIGRNEPCPCGSGKKYKKCHLDREGAAPVPYYESANELLRLRLGDQTCLYPATPNPCTGKVIRAHSISKSTALAKMARGGEVYQLDTNPFAINRNQGRVELRRTKIASATTFTGFCSPHDNGLFDPIDKGNLTPTNEQVLLLHYRAMCRELYVKRPNVETNELLREMDRGKPPEFQAMVQGLVTARGLVIEESIQQLEADKVACDSAILSKEYGVLRGSYVRFRRLTSVACSGYAQPSFDFGGHKVQDVTDLTKSFLNLSFTLLPNESGGIAVFAWLKYADAVCRPFVQSFFSLPDARKSDALIQYTFDSFENFAAQPQWWEGLPEQAQADLKRRALNWTDMGGIDGAALIPGNLRFADWEVDTFGWI